MSAIRLSNRVLFSLLAIGAAGVLATPARADVTLEDCHVRSDENRLVMGNSLIERAFRVDGERLKTMSIRGGDAHIAFSGKRPDVSLDVATKNPKGVDWKVTTVEPTPIAFAHLQVHVLESYAQVDVKRVYRIYPKCPAIGCDVYVRRTSEGAVEFDPEKTILQSHGLPGRHWRFAAAEFYDRTDSINNLVVESSCVGYTRPTLLRGNVLFAKPLAEEVGLFFVKEAPARSSNFTIQAMTSPAR